MIEIKNLDANDPLAFAVTIRDAGSKTHHVVTLSKVDAARLAKDLSPEQCVLAAFRFLLDREAKEQILPRFDISLIARYFPEFERELPRYLDKL